MDGNLVKKRMRDVDAAIEHIARTKRKISAGEVSPCEFVHCCEDLAIGHATIGLYDYFVLGDLSSLKHNIYLSCALKLTAINWVPGGRELIEPEYLLYALFSDSELIIQKFLAANRRMCGMECGGPLSDRSCDHMFELAAIRSGSALSERVRRKFMVFSGDGSLKGEEDFFASLVIGGRRGIEESIYRGIAREIGAVNDEKYFCFMATLKTKLCWRNNLNVQIEHPSVPMGLMPVRPLDCYESTYKFIRI
ncbi:MULTISPECIES: hypothetical protein [Burkholderia]|uniref:hypothetical protein n=1 Tax=Burkholderia TaxID=32008 RepID=UPI00119AF370|nr:MULTISPECIES: hypothetical protein [Burkholderia]TWC56945.1 hypothetical protein FB600_1459 [Burkholderia sp. SJZ089]TWC92186.1 hypothetical protein FBX98_1446 [Burkholderia sp. SJZ115]TWC95337.1 hypothetical protein FB601_1456 [Burkholderia sp. SJZ091]